MFDSGDLADAIHSDSERGITRFGGISALELMTCFDTILTKDS